MDNNKEKIKTAIIIVLVIGIIGAFILPQYLDEQYEKTYQEGYQTGVNDTIIDLATQQTQTGNVLLVYQDTLQAIPIATLCQPSEVQG